MFISKAEKEEMRITIQSLQASVRDLSLNVKSMKLAIIDLEEKSAAKKRPSIRTAEAPYGYKKDGTPKKQPGRRIQKMEITP